MTETHETKRQVTPDEKHFWQRLKISLENSEFIQISSTQVAENNFAGLIEWLNAKAALYGETA